MLRRGWYWGADYRYIVRAQGRGLRGRAVPASYAHGDLAPVVLLAGVLEPWTLLRPIADRLHAAGHPIHVIDELAYNVMPVAQSSELAYRGLVRLGLRGVVLVAHSKGGLIGKHLLSRDREGRIDRLIAVATPFHGSRLARLLPSRTIRALGPTDETILALAKRADLNHRVTSIYPSFDPHIPDGSHLPGAVNVPVAAMGHFRVLSDRQVIDAVIAAAHGDPVPGEPELDDPTPAQSARTPQPVKED